MRSRLSLLPVSATYSPMVEDEEVDTGSEAGNGAEVVLGLGDAACLEVGDEQQAKLLRVPELVVGVEVAVDEHQLRRSCELLVYPVAPAAHTRALPGPDHRHETGSQLLGRGLQPGLGDAEWIV